MNMRFHRRIVHASHRIVAEIALSYASIRQRDLAHKCNGRAEYDGSLHLRVHAIWIDNRSAIYGHIDSRYANLTIRPYVELHDGRRVGEKTPVGGEPDCSLTRSFVYPARLFGNNFCYPAEPCRIERVIGAWLSVIREFLHFSLKIELASSSKRSEPVFNRVLAGHMSELINETLHAKGVIDV